MYHIGFLNIVFYFDLIVKIKIASMIKKTRVIDIVIIIVNVFLITSVIIRIKIILNILN